MAALCVASHCQNTTCTVSSLHHDPWGRHKWRLVWWRRVAPEGDKATVCQFINHTVECYQVFVGFASQVHWHSETPIIVEHLHWWSNVSMTLLTLTLTIECIDDTADTYTGDWMYWWHCWQSTLYGWHCWHLHLVLYGWYCWHLHWWLDVLLTLLTLTLSIEFTADTADTDNDDWMYWWLCWHSRCQLNVLMTLLTLTLMIECIHGTADTHTDDWMYWWLSPGCY